MVAHLLLFFGARGIFSSRAYRLLAFAFPAAGEIRKDEIVKPSDISPLHPDLLQIGHDT